MNRITFVLAAMMIAVGLATAPRPALAAEMTPEALPGAEVVSAEAVRQLLARGPVAVVDLRKKASFAEGHVPGARNMAKAYDDAANAFDVGVLGSDKDATIVLYSHGPDGWKSYHAAKSAVSAGYSNIRWFRGGWMEWHQKGMPIGR